MTSRPLLPGLLPGPATLFDERSRPGFRQVFGRLLANSTALATAVTRIRLSTLDLSAGELEGVRRFRVVVAELNALHLDAEARVLLTRPQQAERVQRLARMLEDGRLEVRSAPLGGWSPDFTVFASGDEAQAVLLGYHQFGGPYPHRGPALSSLHGPDAARLASRRHDELWARAHDVGPALWSLLGRARRQANSLAAAGAQSG